MDYWSIVLPLIVTEPFIVNPPAIALVQDWVLDTGNSGEGFAWRNHLVTAGIDPDQHRMPTLVSIRTAAGKKLVPVRDMSLWLVSNLPSHTPYRIVLERGLPFDDAAIIPDPNLQRPMIGMRGPPASWVSSGNRFRPRYGFGVDARSCGSLRMHNDNSEAMDFDDRIYGVFGDRRVYQRRKDLSTSALHRAV